MHSAARCIRRVGGIGGSLVGAFVESAESLCLAGQRKRRASAFGGSVHPAGRKGKRQRETKQRITTQEQKQRESTISLGKVVEHTWQLKHM